MATTKMRANGGQPFGLSFTDKKTGVAHTNLRPEWTPTVDGKNQSVLLYVPDSTAEGGCRTIVLAVIPIDEPREKLWDLAWVTHPWVDRADAQIFLMGFDVGEEYSIRSQDARSRSIPDIPHSPRQNQEDSSSAILSGTVGAGFHCR